MGAVLKGLSELLERKDLFAESLCPAVAVLDTETVPTTNTRVRVSQTEVTRGFSDNYLN